jgi:ligand-binding SRPBCC domain-containing protein
MSVHTLHTKQIIRATMAEAWSFFSNPRNLAKITPPELGFEMLTPDLPPQVYAGMMIAYRVRPLLGIPMTWLSEITLVEEGVRFIDEQRVGPYAMWHHEHRFHDLGRRTRRDGGQSDVCAAVHAAGGSGTWPWLVKPQLDRIFAHREKAVRELFPA